MKQLFIAIAASLLIIVAVTYFIGGVGVHYTQTVGAAQQDANRKVFEHSQSYVSGKRQAAIKYYKEYKSLPDSSRAGLRNIVAQDFANFDEDKYLTGELRSFIKDCKY